MPPHPMMNPWPLLALWSRIIGFVLLFVGTVLEIAFASVPGSCFTSPSTCGSWLVGAANGIIAGKILWAIGLGALGAGAGIKLHWGLKMPTTGRTDDVTWALADRRLNGLLFLVSIILLAILLFSVNAAPPIFHG